MSNVSDDAGDISMGLAEADPSTSNTAYQPFTKAERIQQLNDIDRSITQLLRSAGLAIKTLTSQHASESPSSTSEPGPRRETFTRVTDTYLQSLHSVDVRLKRQILGLEEARIVAQERDSDQDRANGNADGKGSSEKKSNLDVGWLNSRSGKVERDMESELWAKARTFLESPQIGERTDK